MSALFHKLDGAQAVTRSKGVYRQTDVYHRRGEAYVRHSGGFIRLLGESRTSHPDVLLEVLDLPEGWVVIEDAPRAKVRLVETKTGAAT